MYERAFMVGPLDAFEFHLAENLHMTVARLRTEMPNDEFGQWRAFYAWRTEMRKRDA